MFVALERLLIKTRQPRSRAGELIALRARLRAERAATIEDDERVLAAELLARKVAVADELDAVMSCHSCAKGAPWPLGAYAGGACCAGDTAELFDENELAALAYSGTRPGDLTPPAGDDTHGGCAFRGPRGCTLAVANRPGRCVHYLCDTLRRELHGRGQLDIVEAKRIELSRAMQRFSAVHQARIERNVVASIVDAIETARR